MRSNEKSKRPIELPIEKDEGVRVLGHRDGRGRHVCLPGGGFIPDRMFFEAFYDIEDGELFRCYPVDILVYAVKTGRKNKHREPIYDVTMHVTITMKSGISKHVFRPEVCREIVGRLYQLRRAMDTYDIPRRPPRQGKRPTAPPVRHKGNGVSKGAVAA